jgi:hypothetical protein
MATRGSKRKPTPFTPTDTLTHTETGRKAIDHVRNVRLKAMAKTTVNARTLHEIEQKNADRALTEKQRMFVRFWASGETPRTAAAMAGYSQNSNGVWWALHKDPAILKMYREEVAIFREASKMTRQKVMDMLREAYDMAKIKAEPAVAAAREIGKMCGFYEPEVKININLGAKAQEALTKLSDKELLELIESGDDVLEGEAMRVEEVPQLSAEPSAPDHE